MTESSFEKFKSETYVNENIGVIPTKLGDAQVEMILKKGELVALDKIKVHLIVNGKTIGEMLFDVKNAKTVKMYHLHLSESYRNEPGAEKQFNVAKKWISAVEDYLMSRGITQIETAFYKPFTLRFLHQAGYSPYPSEEQPYVSKRLKTIETVEDYIDFQPQQNEAHGKLLMHKEIK